MYSTFLECISHLCLRHAGQTLKFKRGHLDHVQGLRRFSIVDFDIKPEDATAAGNILVPVESEEAVYVSCTLAAVPNEPKPNDVDSDVDNKSAEEGSRHVESAAEECRDVEANPETCRLDHNEQKRNNFISQTPRVASVLEESGHLETFSRLLDMLDQGTFPLDNQIRTRPSG